jgi:hypothetical protein
MQVKMWNGKEKKFEIREERLPLLPFDRGRGTGSRICCAWDLV